MFDEPSKVLKNTKGSLAETPLPLLLAALLRSRRTCGLELKRQGLEKLIILEEGSPVACTSNLVWETLGKYLVEKKVLTEQQHLALLADSARTGKKLETLLLERKLVDEATLERHLHANLAHRILDCFRWTDARYRVVGDVDVPQGQKMNAARLVFTGVSTQLPIEQVRAHFVERPDQRFALLPSEAKLKDDLRLSDKDLRLFDLLQRRPTLAQVPEHTGLSEEETLRRMYALAVLGVVDHAEKVPVAPPKPASPAAAPAPDPAEEAALEALRRQQQRRPWVVLSVLLALALAGGGAWQMFLRPRPAPGGAVAATRPQRPPKPPRPPPERTLLPAPPGTRAAPVGLEPLAFSASGVTFAPPVPEGKGPLEKPLGAAATLLEEEEFAQAEAAYESLSRRAPSSPDAWYGLALAHYAQRQDAEAEAAVAHALEASPEHAPSSLLAAALKLRSGNGAEARALLERALRALPSSTEKLDWAELAKQLP